VVVLVGVVEGVVAVVAWVVVVGVGETTVDDVVGADVLGASVGDGDSVLEGAFSVVVEVRGCSVVELELELALGTDAVGAASVTAVEGDDSTTSSVAPNVLTGATVSGVG